MSTQQTHFNQLKHCLHESHTLTLEECSQAKLDFIKFVENTIKTTFQRNTNGTRADQAEEYNCYVYGIYATNFEKFDIELIR